MTDIWEEKIKGSQLTDKQMLVYRGLSCDAAPPYVADL